MIHRRLFLPAALSLVLGTPVTAQFFNPFGATEITQLMNHAQLLAQHVVNLDQLNKAIQTYNEIVRAGRMLTGSQWTNLGQALRSITSIMQSGQSVAGDLAQLDGRFSRVFRRFDPHGRSYSSRYRDWAETTMDTIQNVLRGTGVRWEQLDQHDWIINWLQSQSGTATTQMQTLQIGNRLGVESMKQMTELQQTMLSDIQSRQAFQAYTVQKDMDKQSFDANFYRHAPVRGDGIKF